MRYRFVLATLASSLMFAVPAFAEESEASGQLALADNETFLLPIDNEGNTLPAYPEAVLTQQEAGARYICMRVDIGEEGTVTYTGPVIRAPECPEITQLTKQFVDVTAEALKTWTFEPAIRCVFRNKGAKEAAGMSCQGGKENPQATSLTFRFLFDQVEGKGVVRMQR